MGISKMTKIHKPSAVYNYFFTVLLDQLKKSIKKSNRPIILGNRHKRLIFSLYHLSLKQVN